MGKRRGRGGRDPIGALQRLEELKGLSLKAGVSGVLLNVFPMHVRVSGQQTVDYWPATERAWIVGAKESVKPVSPAEVVEWALQEPPSPNLFPEGALDHLRSIQ
jgi:hypothetical protein